jgi:hypothetical protein
LIEEPLAEDEETLAEDEAPSGVATASVAIVASSVVLSSVFSLLSSSGSQGAFSSIHQYQLYILLPMIGAYMPNEIVDILLGMKFVTFSFSFLGISGIPIVTNAIDKIDFNQNDDYLENIGLESGSSVVNYLPLLTVLLLMGIMHLIYLPFYIKLCKNR